MRVVCPRFVLVVYAACASFFGTSARAQVGEFIEISGDARGGPVSQIDLTVVSLSGVEPFNLSGGTLVISETTFDSGDIITSIPQYQDRIEPSSLTGDPGLEPIISNSYAGNYQSRVTSTPNGTQLVIDYSFDGVLGGDDLILLLGSDTDAVGVASRFTMVTPIRLTAAGDALGPVQPLLDVNLITELIYDSLAEDGYDASVLVGLGVSLVEVTLPEGDLNVPVPFTGSVMQGFDGDDDGRLEEEDIFAFDPVNGPADLDILQGGEGTDIVADFGGRTLGSEFDAIEPGEGQDFLLVTTAVVDTSVGEIPDTIQGGSGDDALLSIDATETISFTVSPIDPNLSIRAVPEPSSLAILASLFGIVARRRR